MFHKLPQQFGQIVKVLDCQNVIHHQTQSDISLVANGTPR